jgi:hypothetical protein
MRFKELTKSSKDRETPVFNFALGRKELELLLGICITTRRYLPANQFDLDPIKQRLNNMINCMNKTLIKYKDNGKDSI